MYAKRVKQQNGQERRKLPGDDKQPRSRADTDSVQVRVALRFRGRELRD